MSACGEVNKLATMSVEDPFNLASMDTAVNYNASIADMIHARAQACANRAAVAAAGSGAINVLDFGAGRGVFANTFGQRITCVEPDARVGAHISGRHRVVPSLVHVEEPVDFAYSINVLEHIEDDLAILYGLAGAMKQGGVLFLLLPAYTELFTEMDRYVGHYRRYDQQDICAKLRAAGFMISRVRNFDLAGYYSTLFCKYAGKVINWKGSLTPGSVVAYDRFVFPASLKLDALTGGRWRGKNILVDAVKIG